MSDLIDRQALLRQIDIDSEGEPGYYGDTWKFIDTIKRMPPALGTNLAQLGTDCISRQAAINAIDECYCGGEDSCGEPWIYQENAVEAINMIEPLPSAEPQIIRCKDCKNWDTTWKNDWAKDYHYCPLIDGTRRGDWYCADAERRTDETD